LLGSATGGLELRSLLRMNLMLYFKFIHLFIDQFTHMSRHADTIRRRLSAGPLSARQLVESLDVSQPTISR
jgi:hypothetical protein